MIIPCSSGVVYQNQTGGYACLQDSIEGVFVPLFDTSSERYEALHDFFVGEKWRECCHSGIDGETADFIDGVLAKSPGAPGIKVDWNRLSDSHEAWIHVTLAAPATTLVMEGFDSTEAILTWPNSD